MEENLNAEKKSWVTPTVTVRVQPEDKVMELPRPKTARQLLAALNLREETALVVRLDDAGRDEGGNSLPSCVGELLTPDRRIYGGQSLLVRKVTSSG